MGIRICAWLLLLASGVLNFYQNEFKVTYERMEIASYNTGYISIGRTHNFKYNRTKAVTNMTFWIVRDFTGKIDIEVQAYRMASNEYRLFPIRFSFNFCDYVAKNEFGIGELYRCGNLTGCPFKKGVHHICNWSLNGSRFPPHVPAGEYMVDLKYIYRNTVFLFLQTYGTIKYPVVKGFSIF